MRIVIFLGRPLEQAVSTASSLVSVYLPAERSSMRVCLGIAELVLAVTLAGCGDAAPPAGPVEFKGSSSDAINKFRDKMSENVKTKAIYQKSAPETKPSDKPSEKK
jgi:hypothetical protein